MSDKTSVILSSSYFPPIPWFAVAARSGKIIVDIHEHYIKQTWRNRCCIATANGLMNLVIPVEKYRNHTPVQDIRIDYATDWQRNHEHAIRSAYGKSAYFEFYADKFLPMYEWQPEYLLELNEATFEAMNDILKLNIQSSNSEEYCEPEADSINWRSVITPASVESSLFPSTGRYIQVFEDRFGFQPGLSILDLLFCSGPDSKNILMKGE